MKLDISCIRAILFTVEKYETLYDPVSFDDTKYDYYSDYLSEYDTEQILYHVQYCIKANLLSDVSGTKAWGHTQFDCSLCCMHRTRGRRKQYCLGYLYTTPFP